MANNTRVPSPTHSIGKMGFERAKIHKRQHLEPAQRRRVRVAYITIALFICGFSLLALTSAGDKKPETVSVAEYLNHAGSEEKEDPLGLIDRIAGFELTGISNDDSVLGYTSETSCLQSAFQLKEALQADGWTLTSDNGLGLMSFQRDKENGSDASYLLVQCMSVGQESSIVIQRW